MGLMESRTMSLNRLLVLVMLAILLPALVAIVASVPDVKRYMRMIAM